MDTAVKNLALLVVFVLLVVGIGSYSVSANPFFSQSPSEFNTTSYLSTPTPTSPTQDQRETSPHTRVALEYLTQKTDTSPAQFLITSEEPRHFLHLDRLFWRVGLFSYQDETKVEAIYKSDSKYGSHQLITVTVNSYEPRFFGTHPDNEDVLLIGDPVTKPMWFIIATCKKDQFQKKIVTRTLSNDDFVVFHSKFFDPEVSFFTMLKDTPHGECTIEREGKPPSFYVTEPTDMPLDITDFNSYQIQVSI